MINCTSRQVYSSNGLNYDNSKSPVSSRLVNYINNYQALNSFYPKYNTHKKMTSNLTELNSDTKKIGLNQIFSSSNNKNKNNVPIIQNLNKIFSLNKTCNDDNYTQRLYTSENINISNMNNSGVIDEGKNDYSMYDNKPTHGIVHSETNFMTPSSKIAKMHKIPRPIFMKKKYSDQNQLFNQYENNVSNNKLNPQIYSEVKRDKCFKNLISELNKSADNLTNNIFGSSNGGALDNYNSNYSDEEPKNNFKLSDLTIIKEIGKGAEGVVYVICWKKNNKKYAMKKCQIMFPTNVNKRKNDNATLKRFIETTGCDGIIKPYATLCKTNEIGFTDCYEIMELADNDWESEIMKRGKAKRYYTEYELIDIFKYLIKTFALLQSNHITHRDIKPQNIMLANGKLKICDFGNARVLKRNGIIIQRIRGSELFMSPIVFKGYRSGIQNIRHNAYKSDVYSLGICFFLAATLSYDGPNVIRLMNDMKKIKKALDYNLAKRYSQNMINMILTMLQIEESKRPDFLDLEILFP